MLFRSIPTQNKRDATKKKKKKNIVNWTYFVVLLWRNFSKDNQCSWQRKRGNHKKNQISVRLHEVTLPNCKQTSWTIITCVFPRYVSYVSSGRFQTQDISQQAIKLPLQAPVGWCLRCFSRVLNIVWHGCWKEQILFFVIGPSPK